jgi:hypothetical protein
MSLSRTQETKKSIIRPRYNKNGTLSRSWKKWIVLENGPKISCQVRKASRPIFLTGCKPEILQCKAMRRDKKEVLPPLRTLTAYTTLNFFISADTVLRKN